MPGAKNNVKSSNIQDEKRLKILEDIERQKRSFSQSSSGLSANLNTVQPSTSSSTASSISNVEGYRRNDSTDLSNIASNYAAGFGTIGNKDNEHFFSGGSSNKKQVFEQAVKTSFGHYIYQDSSFGNTILPVIPRFTELEAPISPKQPKSDNGILHVIPKFKESKAPISPKQSKSDPPVINIE